MAESSTRTAERAQQLPDSSAPHSIHYLEPLVQENSDYQVQWSNWISGGEQKSLYARVFVLLLSWHPECDDMAVQEEVQRLKSVFETKYNYEVQSFQIDSRLKALPQIQANATVADFVMRNDQDDALFIIYYAGHGSPGKNQGHLNMSARRRDKEKTLSQQYSHITWNYVESNLKTTCADVFLIFDCCYAGDLGRESSFTSRSFEYLAATESSYTRSPGIYSFTSALIWALEELATATPSASPMFTTSKLAKTICECPTFPKDQKPSLTTRDQESWKHIILAPLLGNGVSETRQNLRSEDEDDDSDEEEIPKPIPQYINLTFHFKRKQDDTELKKLAVHLSRFMKTESKDLQNVEWGGIWEGPRQLAKHRFRQLVLKVVSASKGSQSPSRIVDHGERLYPQWPHSPGPSSIDENTPLISGASSAIFNEPLEHPSFWSWIQSFYHGLRKPRIVEPEANASSESVRKLFASWRRHLENIISRLFRSRSSRIQI